MLSSAQVQASLTFAALGFATSLFATPASAKVVLRLNEWPGYVSMHKEHFQEFARSKGLDVEIEVIKPDITDDVVIVETIKAGRADVLTPTEGFLHDRDDALIKLLAPIDPKKVPGYENVPESLRTSSYHRSGDKVYGIAFMAGFYGLYYNTKRVKDEPTSWEFLWTPAAKGRFSVSKETGFVNAYIAAWAMDPSKVENAYDIDKLPQPKLKEKLKALAANAHHLWTGSGNTPDELKTIDYTVSWGFELDKDWKRAYPKPGSSIWVDVLAITAEAAKDPKKLAAYYLLAAFLVQPSSQTMFEEKLRAVPLTVSGPFDLPIFDSRFFWRPMSAKTSDGFMALWNAASKK